MTYLGKIQAGIFGGKICMASEYSDSASLELKTFIHKKNQKSKHLGN